jgi:hypothetical protein
MSDLRYTLLADGPADRALIPILDWLLRQHLPARPVQPQFAELRNLRPPPASLVERLKVSIALYPCEILFVHRDAEAEPPQNRVGEINRALQQASLEGTPPLCCVVPVRMTEAWLLFEEAAIRKASGNPNGRIPLDIPSVPESVVNPKDLLERLLRDASGLSGRRRKKFSVPQTVQRLAQLIEDFSPLRGLGAFQSLEADLKVVLRSLGGR